MLLVLLYYVQKTARVHDFATYETKIPVTFLKQDLYLYQIQYKRLCQSNCIWDIWPDTGILCRFRFSNYRKP